MPSVIPYQPPEYESTGFNCPRCHAYSTMHWATAYAHWNNGGGSPVDDIDFARCGRCKAWSIWSEEEMIFPDVVGVDTPNDDLPEGVKADYVEAASILQKSPRGAAALLRLAIQKLCDSLVVGSDDLNTKIGTLVSRGLDSRVQKALDIVRVIGNDAVHPGQIDWNDKPETAHQLFKLVNLIGQRMITEPAEINAIYLSLPEEKRQGIEKRDKKK